MYVYEFSFSLRTAASGAIEKKQFDFSKGFEVLKTVELMSVFRCQCQLLIKLK